jgi:hypothetical protein
MVNIKQKLFKDFALVQIKRGGFTINAHLSGGGCRYAVKCSLCLQKKYGFYNLLPSLIKNWEENKPCHH